MSRALERTIIEIQSIVNDRTPYDVVFDTPSALQHSKDRRIFVHGYRIEEKKLFYCTLHKARTYDVHVITRRERGLWRVCLPCAIEHRVVQE
jgi:hypothetical protein